MLVVDIRKVSTCVLPVECDDDALNLEVFKRETCDRRHVYEAAVKIIDPLSYVNHVISKREACWYQLAEILGDRFKEPTSVRVFGSDPNLPWNIFSAFNVSPQMHAGVDLALCDTFVLDEENPEMSGLHYFKEALNVLRNEGSLIVRTSGDHWSKVNFRHILNVTEAQFTGGIQVCKPESSNPTSPELFIVAHGYTNTPCLPTGVVDDSLVRSVFNAYRQRARRKAIAVCKMVLKRRPLATAEQVEQLVEACRRNPNIRAKDQRYRQGFRYSILGLAVSDMGQV